MIVRPGKSLFIIGFLALTLSACGLKGQVRGEGGLVNAQGEGGMFGSPRSPASSGSPAELPDEIMGARIEEKNFDIPVVLNKEVEHWIRYFTQNGRKHFAIYLQRMGQMSPLILPKLREAGLPEDLIYLAMIESGFSTRAKSHAGAVGPWQFIRGTGRIFDLKIDVWRDERRDPAKSTVAATRYLKKLYNDFDSWELATAAYNSGELKIIRAMKKLNTRDFWTISRNRRALRRETKDYVPKMMAAAIVGKNAEAFGFDAPKIDPVWNRVEYVRIPKAEDLNRIAEVTGLTKEEIKDLNPELSRACTPPENYTLRLPHGDATDKLVAAIDKGEIGTYQDFRRHVITRGDSLSKIAKKYGAPSEAILALNEISSARALRPGTEIVIPSVGYETYKPERSRRIAKVSRSKRSPASIAVRPAAASIAAKGNDSNKPVVYVVKRGDTLYDISRRFSVPVRKIQGWNSIRNKKNIRPGNRLKLYVMNDV